MFSFVNNINKNSRKIHNFNKKNIVTNIPPVISQNVSSKTVSLFSQPYLDTYNQCYKNIVVINLMPQGPLAELVTRVKFEPLSEFKVSTPCNPYKQCGLALMSINNFNNCMSNNYMSNNCMSNNCMSNKCLDLMDVNEVPNLISFLVSNGYTVDTSITKMFNNSEIRFDTNTGNKLICFVTYNGL